ncbi:Polyketide synthase module [Legionella gratiana]|uniref:Polyketide synthase module n=1 Tax=Legionella gratiana TaxID=45066 RepID=A0A378JFE5_9GAMM|nr:type I polyketide synthase [Legionella gratiana]KTD11896.1 Polyketide synthase module [Legionella gratiana]STX46512.1 Polyketide synthase module [Legionella gratiana]
MKQYESTYARNVVELFEECVQNSSNNSALIDENVQYTYKELNEKANQLAHCLISKKVEKGSFVAILLDPGAEYIIFILAIIKIGAVYLPLDSQAPKTRLKEIISDANPSLIITNDTYQRYLTEANKHVALTKQLHLESISCSKENLNIFILPESAIYMIYTSGSTGRPKGVIIPHQAVVNLTKVENYARVQEHERVAQFNNLAFDACTFEIWSAFLNGAALCIIPTRSRKNHTELKHCLKDNKINHILLPTGLFHQLIKSAIKVLDSVNSIVFGGEQINLALLKEFINYRKNLEIPTQLINGYGPSEATTVACRKTIDINRLESDEELSSIGNKFCNVETYVLDEHLNLVREGELHLSGVLLALGYHNCPEQNAEKFIKNPFCSKPPYEKLYKTGDLVKILPSGDLLYTGRVDDQVKIGGFRIHLNEIEQRLMKHPNISLAAVVVELGGEHHKMLTAYIVFSTEEEITHADAIRSFLAQELPPYMLPSKYVMVDELPLTRIGKIDKKSLDSIPHTDLSFHIDTSSSNDIEEKIKNIWKYLLNRPNIETHKNLFDLGANSLFITEACTLINKELQSDLQISDLLTYPTIHKLSQYLLGDVEAHEMRKKYSGLPLNIAIVGMSCRFPGANSVHEFWDNLCQGKDCLTRFNENDSQSTSSDHSNYVPVKGILSDIQSFDASFFGFNPTDASITDPQQRIFLECAWEALEHAAIAPSKLKSTVISVFAGMTDSTYLHENLLKNQWFCNEHDTFQQRIATSMCMLSTQSSYRLNLKGKSVNINTACSTGLVTVDQACQDLILFHSDIALAGTSSITVPQNKGYMYQNGSIVSPDGYCRPFSKQANGTVFSNGVGVVVLKRLEDAIKDNDTIYAVIKGSGVNNDGADKLGFTAPSFSGQMECIRDALMQAQISSENVSFLEAHGTATALGDVIEINALNTVYREQTDKKQFCVLGSVKANIGHTDVTAGIAGLIKTALCLYHKKIPPLIHFDEANPDLSLDESPFYINTDLMNWKQNPSKRFAGVSSFGIGGTNIHMILSEHNRHQFDHNVPPKREELILLSAKTEAALKQHVHQFSDYLQSNCFAEEQLANIAYTLQTGREDFQYRQFAVGSDPKSIIKELKKSPIFFYDEDTHHEIVFMFSGQGTQYHHMAMDLFEKSPFFRKLIQQGVSCAATYLNCDLLAIICTPQEEQLTHTEYTQPSLFIIEYALARLLIEIGIKPELLIGHSIGEYVAACIAGVFSYEDAIALVCERGLLMAKTAQGAMITLECSEDECIAYQEIAHIDLALHNATHHYVFSGTLEAIQNLEDHLASINKPYQKLRVSHAFHSRLMDSIEKPFKDIFANIILSPPKLPIVSNVTGSWLSATDAMSPDYWYKHLRHSVQFYKGIDLLLHDKHPFFLEIGLGQSLCNLVKEISAGKANVVHTLPNHHQCSSDLHQLLLALGHLWTKGVAINLKPIEAYQSKQHISLPTYPFQKQRYWIDANQSHQQLVQGKPCMYQQTWSRYAAYTQAISLSLSSLKEYNWIIFKDESKLGDHFISLFMKHKIQPMVVTLRTHYKEQNKLNYEINPNQKKDYLNFVQSIKKNNKTPVVLHCSSYTNQNNQHPSTKEIDTQLTRGLYSLFYLAQSCVEELGTNKPIKIAVITQGAQQIIGSEITNPLNATLIGACRVMMQEHNCLTFKLFDLNIQENPHNNSKLLHKIIDICMNSQWNEESLMIPLRNGYQWNLMYGEIKQSQSRVNRLKDRGVYLVTGGLGGIALSFCEAIANTVHQPTFILLSRSLFPPEHEWKNIFERKNNAYDEKIKQIRTLQQLGATIVFYQVDINQLDQLESVIHQCITRFTHINGLIHTAGVSSPNLMIDKAKEEINQVLQPKINGTYNLIYTLQKQQLDFVVLTSSLAALLGGFQYMDYCAANSGLDSFVASNLFSFSSFVVSINWNTWSDVGLAAKAAAQGVSHFIGRGNDISSSDGKKIFLEILQGVESQVAVSNIDINSYTKSTDTQHETFLQPNPIVARQHIPIKTQYAAPTNETESKLVQLWQNMLGIDSIGIYDDFFALGGHSLRALNLIEKINREFHCTLPATQLYRTATIKHLSLVINDGSDMTKDHILVPLKKVLQKPPYLFLCHPIIGLPYCFNPLISQSDLPLSIYGVQDPSIDANQMLYDNLLDMANDYFLAIKKIQPTGPYFLMGYSFGGTVFYEVAHLMRQEGQEVKLLALIDSWAIDSQLHQDEHYFKNMLQRIDEKPSKQLIDLAWEREKLLRNHSITEMNQKIILFKASQLNDEYKAIDHEDNGWSNYSKETIICHKINGNHDTIIDRDNSKQILALIKSELINLGINNEIL